MVWLLSILICGSAHAGAGKEGLAAARVALAAGEYERSGMLLIQARMNLPTEDAILDAQTIAEVIYLETIAARLRGVERKSDVDRWRDALNIYPSLKWDRELLNDKGLRAYFEALRQEVSQREPSPTRVPERRGLMRAFVDGVEHGPGQAVRAGPHLLQVLCPSGAVAGEWSDLSERTEWIEMCREDIDLSVVPAIAEADEFGLDEPDPRAGPEPLVWVEPEPKKRNQTGLGLGPQDLWLGASAMGVAAVVTYGAALAARGKYDDLDDDPLNSPSALKDQRTRTNRLVGATGGFMLLGSGMAVAATMGVEF
jgi:hypothetical protein